jgi:hypothetical protein
MGQYQGRMQFLQPWLPADHLPSIGFLQLGSNPRIVGITGRDVLILLRFTAMMEKSTLARKWKEQFFSYPQKRPN